MPNRELLERARMFEERAERATDPISRQHYREMAAHYRTLSIEQTATRDPKTARTERFGPGTGFQLVSVCQ